VIIFFSLWGFAMLAFIANLAVGVLSLFKGSSPIEAAISLSTIFLLVEFFLRLCRYARISPFIFTEEDAILICQTPVDRRQVALARLFGDWIPAGLPYWAGAVTLSFACQELAAPNGMILARLPVYLITGLRAVSIILPLHLAFMAAAYVFGASRLRRGEERNYLRLIPIGVGLCLLLLAIFFPASLHTIFWPFLYPLEAGFGSTSWISGFILSIFLTMVSLAGLYIISPELNLSRASQESNIHWVAQQAEMKKGQSRTHQWFGAKYLVNLIPAHAGVWVLIWKDWIQTIRRFDFRSVIFWLALFGTGIGIMIAPDLGTRIWVFVVWGLLIGQVCSKRFCSDLNMFVLFRQLPFSIKGTLVTEIGIPVIGATVLCWLGFGISSLIDPHPSLPVVLLAPGIILCITLSVVFDILRQSKADALLAGRSVEMGAFGLLLGLILTGLPLLLVMWLSNRMSAGFFLWFVYMLGLILSLGIAYGLWLLTASQYKKI
jgi:heme/copper-type cytochrome/quinol oxidase subunit 4